MIKFFQVNDPLRLLVVLFLLLAIRIPFMVLNTDLFQFELLWTLLGERMADGYSIYVDIDDTTSVFSAGIYWLINLAFGKSYLPYYILSTLLVYLQAVMLNDLVNQFNLLKDRSYVVAFVYIILANCAPDFFTLSPDLMGTTFLIIMSRVLFAIMKGENTDDNFLILGWCMGFAIMFNIHYIYFLLVLILALLFYTTAVARRYVLLVIGSLLPLGLCSIYFLFQGRYEFYFYEFVVFPLSIYSTNYVRLIDVLIVLSPMWVLGLFSIPKIYNGQGFVNFDVRCQSVLLMWLVCSILCGMLNEKFTFFAFYSGIVPLCYFISGFLMNIRKQIFRFIFSYGFIIASIIFGFSSIIWKEDKARFLSFSNLTASESAFEFKDKQLLVLSDDYSFYRNNELGARFLNWKIASKYFMQLDYFNPVIKVQKAFSTEKPEIIYDPNNYMEKVMYRIPELRTYYTRDKGNFYILNADID